MQEIAIIRWLRALAQKYATHKLVAFCRTNNLSIPEDATLRRHFLTQLQSELESAG